MDDKIIQLFISSGLSSLTALLGIFIKNYVDERNKKRDYRTKLTSAEFFKEQDKTFFEKIVTPQIKEQYFLSEFGILIRHNEDFEKWAEIKEAKNLSWSEIKNAHASGYLYLDNGIIKKKSTYDSCWFLVFLIVMYLFGVACLMYVLITEKKYIALPVIIFLLAVCFYNILKNFSSYRLYKKISKTK